MTTETPAELWPTSLTPEVMTALAQKFDPSEVKYRDGGFGKQLAYIDARVVDDRLDEIVGSANWSDEYVLLYVGEPGTRMVRRTNRDTGEVTEREVPFQRIAVECRLTILGVTKVDAGQAQEEEEGFKSAYSDALKRAAVKFGIGRYLYQGELPERARQNGHSGATEARQTASAPRQAQSYGPPRQDAREMPATESQVRAIYAIARSSLALDEQELDERCRDRYGVTPGNLNRRQASEFIDYLKMGLAARVQ